MRRILTLVAAALPLVPQIALAAEPPCLTPAEFTALSSYALPSMINGTTQRCAAALPKDAWLRRNGPELASRYAAARPAAWPKAKAAFQKLAPAVNPDVAGIVGKLPDETLQQLADAWIEASVGQQVPLDRCGPIDRTVSLLAPLPPESTAELIGLAVGFSSRTGGGRIGKLAICPATPATTINQEKAR